MWLQLRRQKYLTNVRSHLHTLRDWRDPVSALTVMPRSINIGKSNTKDTLVVSLSLFLVPPEIFLFLNIEAASLGSLSVMLGALETCCPGGTGVRKLLWLFDASLVRPPKGVTVDPNVICENVIITSHCVQIRLDNII